MGKGLTTKSSIGKNVIFGKIIGGVLGFYAGHIIGAIIGVAIGHYFDKSFSQALNFDFSADRERLQKLFFETTFMIMGHIAKADGRVSEEEITQSEALMIKLGLNAEHRKKAIELFKLGSQPDFQLEPVIATFVNEGGKQRNLQVLLLEFLFSIALADGKLHDAEQEILSRTAAGLGINTRYFERLLSMLKAQQQFRGQHQNYGQAVKEDELENAYKALGVKSSDSDRDIKRSYRKLMSQHHPDKLIAEGVPQEMVVMATEKAQKIQAAYDLIKNTRNKKFH